MRKLLYTLAGLRALALFASCNKEAESPVPSGGLTASFTVSAPGTVATKGISEGTAATDFFFAVYDEENNYLEGLSTPVSEGGAATITGTSSPRTVTIPVVKDMTYQFVFAAKSASDNGFCTFNPEAATLVLDYTKLKANDDKADFFYVKDQFTVTDSFSKNETMTRPLAQVNVGAADLLAAGYSIKTDESLLTGISLTGINNTMNLLDGSVSGAADIEWGKATRVQDDSQFVTGYDRISMVYVLAAAASQTSNATLNVEAEGLLNTTAHTITRSVPNIPLQRNYRTNILGNIFTNDFIFTVETEPGFVDADGNANPDHVVEYIQVASVSDLQTLLDALSGSSSTDAQSYVVEDVQPNSTAPNTTDIIIKDNTLAEAVSFDLRSIDTEVHNIVIRDETQTDNESVQYGNNINIVLPEDFDLSNLTVYAPFAHITVKQGNVETIIASTSGSTLVVGAGASIEILKVKTGNVSIEKGGKVTSIVREEGNTDEKTLVYIEDFADWLNISSEKSAIIVPVVNGEDEILPEDYVVSTAKQLENALKVSGAHKVFVSPGTYEFTDYGAGTTCASRYSNADFTIIGIGEVVFNSPKYGLVLGSTEEGHEVTLKNLTINAAWIPVYIKDQMTANLHDLKCNVTGSGKTTILMDNHNKINGVHVGGTICTVNAHDITVSEGGIVELMAKPSSYSISEGCGYEMITYCYFNYDGNCNFADIKAQDSSYMCYSTGSNLFVNDEPLPPYTKDGEIAIKDEEGNWQIVAGYTYDTNKTEMQNGAALIKAIRASKDSEAPFYIGSGTYVMDGDNCRVSGTASGGNGTFDIRGLGDVVIKGGSLYGLNFNAPEPYVVTAKLSDVTVEGGSRCPIYCRGNVTLDMSNVTLKKGSTYSGDNAINIDAGSDKKDGQTITVNCYNVNIEEGMKAEFIACPFSTEGYGEVTSYINFDYDNACNFPADVYRVDARNTGSGNIKVNGVAVN